MSEGPIEKFPFEEKEKPEVPKEESKAVVVKAPIALSERGELHPTNHSEAWRISEMLLDSRALPQVFKNVAQVFMARQFLIGLNLVPEIAIRQITIINGSLSIWGELPKAICEKSGLLEWMEEKIFDKDYKEICPENKNLEAEVWLATCEVKRKERPKTRKTWFTMDDAKTAGLLSKLNSVWKVYPRRMIQMRARSLALKDEFPEILSGVAITEYDHDILMGAPTITSGSEQPDLAKTLNEKFLPPAEAASA